MPSNSERIAELEAELARYRETQDYVRQELERLIDLDWSDVFFPDGRIKPIDAWPNMARRYVVSMEVQELYTDGELYGVVKKIRLPSKLDVLKTLGTHKEVDSFRPDTSIVINDGSAERIIERRRLRLEKDG